MDEELLPARVVSPGRILIRELDARNWTQRDLADIMGRPYQAINEIIKGAKQITPETALDLSQVFGTSPEFWTNLEANYRVFLAKQKKDRDAIARKSQLYSLAPVAELIRLGWIRRVSTIDDLEHEMCKFLDITSPSQTPTVAVNFRHAEERGPELYAQIAWVKRVQHLAAAQPAADFDPQALASAIPSILMHSREAGDVRNVPARLLSLGIHFLVVPHLSKTYVDGAMLRFGTRPIVAVTLRYDRIDAFWFTLMHELAHIVAAHSGNYLDSFENAANGTDNSTEDEANRMASEWLIDPFALDAFVREVSPHVSEPAIERFARSQARHPGIILGQLQKRGVVDFGHMRRLLVKVSPLLSDWIDVPSPRLVAA